MPRNLRATYLLRALARESGGQAYFPSGPGELGRLYDRIAHELRSQYNIGYVSTHGRHDGAWRQILVMAPQHEGLLIRHRLGYFAESEAPRPGSRRTSRTPALASAARP
jgi:hypothetical protein